MRKLIAIFITGTLVLTLFADLLVAAPAAAATTPVFVPATSIDVTNGGAGTTVVLGAALQMEATVLPAEATEQKVIWLVENTKGSAKIDAVTGSLTGLRAGAVRVEALAEDGSGIKGYQKLTVVPKPLVVLVLQIGQATFTCNGLLKGPLETPPIIQNGRTLVPIRAIVEALGGTVSWTATTKKATVTLGNTILELWLGKNAATLNGESTLIDATNTKVVPELLNSRLLLPLNFVAVELGCEINWTALTKTITITSPGPQLEYQNPQYGFGFALPESWKGYTIITTAWQGYANGPKGDMTVEKGPLLSIRNPTWTVKQPYQDIPIMVFTLAQWDSLLLGKFYIGAAPINPARLGFNAKYVFAIPARYNYAFPRGFAEVDQILQTNPLRALPSAGTISEAGQVLLCGGLPNGSTQRLTGTTQLFINLPKALYPDKLHNLQFKIVSGTVTALAVTSAGPYGESFGAEGEPACWSYYYKFAGKGEIDLTVKNVDKTLPAYFVRFIIS